MRWIMALAAILAFNPARAEVGEIRFAQQFSMGYLQFNVMKHQDLLAKHVAALGLPEVKVNWVTFSGPDMMNDALLSGSIDIASGGMPGLLTIWAKMKGSAQEVLLEMAAAREWGDAAYDRLDKLTFSLSPPDATGGLLAGGGDFNTAFTVPPFQTMQLRDPAIHTVLSSGDVIVPPSGGTAWASHSAIMRTAGSIGRLVN